jgi:hypothetical protein
MTDREKISVALKVPSALEGRKIYETKNTISVSGIRRFYFNKQGELINIKEL